MKKKSVKENQYKKDAELILILSKYTNSEFNNKLENH